MPPPPGALPAAPAVSEPATLFPSLPARCSLPPLADTPPLLLPPLVEPAAVIDALPPPGASSEPHADDKSESNSARIATAHKKLERLVVGTTPV
jgi:hypothetical protein